MDRSPEEAGANVPGAAETGTTPAAEPTTAAETETPMTSSGSATESTTASTAEASPDAGSYVGLDMRVASLVLLLQLLLRT